MSTNNQPDNLWAGRGGDPELFARVMAILKSGALARCNEADAKVLLCLIARADWRRCVCWPAIPTIQAESGICRSSVYTSLRRLAELGLLRIGSQALKCRDGRRRTGNVYEILQPPPRPPQTPNTAQPARSAPTDLAARSARSATADNSTAARSVPADKNTPARSALADFARSAGTDPNLACSNLAGNLTRQAVGEDEERGRGPSTAPAAAQPTNAAAESDAQDAYQTDREDRAGGLRLRSPMNPSQLQQELSRAEMLRRLAEIDDSPALTRQPQTPAAAGQESTV